ncbi:hypothetical protein EYB26_007395 [Talaromyces marneffei]|uniref:uncharacterized protein n=1 Tax=Talaromyces marneffei TaxID=37727 RepID=UPI0012A9F170|nr:uncharacterized protein EYB26_007395 [Talaromyces marneffei]QGA19703.1 hypothetical protein EYB26_007395 [Talaromyces marneffei]
MSQASLAPPEVWRHLLRATLRECSYLPDPVARKYMHKYVLERYRKKSAAFTADEQKFEQARRPSAKHQQRLNAASLERQKNLQKSARNFLSLIRRGNQGYQQPLDRILMLAYGRIGAKKYTLLSKLVPNGRGGNKVFNSSADIEEYLEQKKKEPAGAYWEVPEVLQALIKSQRNDSFARSAHGKRFRASDTVNIPKLNAWMKPLPECRQENLRKRLLNRSKYAALPPADPAEANLLRGLIDGTEPWKPPVRRTKVSPAAEQSPLETLVHDGPQGGRSFKAIYRNGRPHRLTRRFMRTLWEKVYRLLPEQGINLRGQTKFDFPTTFKARTYVLTMEKGEFQALFGNKDRDHDCNAASTAASGQK